MTRPTWMTRSTLRMRLTTDALQCYGMKMIVGEFYRYRTDEFSRWNF